MPITTDNRPLPLFAYNQMLNAEMRQVPTEPADKSKPRYFLFPKGRVQDTEAFVIEYDGLWMANGELTLVIQRLPMRDTVLVGEIS